MTTDNLREILAALRGTEPSETVGEFRIVALCHSAGVLRVFIAVSGNDRNAAIVIELPKNLLPNNLSSEGSRRFAIVASELPGLPPERGAVVIQLRDSQFEDLFIQLGIQLIEEIRKEPESAEALRVALRLIDRWRRFLDRHRAILSQEEVRGLIGELAVLGKTYPSYWATSSGWLPGSHLRAQSLDFECSDRSIEAKTFISSAGTTVRINDPLQLEPEPGIPLLLACQELVRSQQAEFTLPGHIARIVRLIAADVVLGEDFEDALASAGYLASHAEFYDQAFALGEMHVFQVLDGVPSDTCCRCSLSRGRGTVLARNLAAEVIFSFSRHHDWVANRDRIVTTMSQKFLDGVFRGRL